LCDIDCVENLLINDDDIVGLTNERNRNKPIESEPINFDDDDDGHLGGMDDHFDIPCTAQTNAPFYSQNGGEFEIQSQFPNDNLIMPPPPNLDMSRFDGENLIQAPLQVNALNIEYAKTSKNIDVRKLKQIIWNLLNENNKVKLIFLIYFSLKYLKHKNCVSRKMIVICLE